MASSGKKQKVAKDELRKETEAMLLSPLLIEGDLRNLEYWQLVNEASVVIFERYFGTSKRKGWVAACCRAWGDETSLKEKNHCPGLIMEGKQGGLGITDQQSLYKWIVGNEPDDPTQPWIVQFPKTTVECKSPPRDHSNWFKLDLPHATKLVFQTTSCQEMFLGKRTSSLELNPVVSEVFSIKESSLCFI